MQVGSQRKPGVAAADEIALRDALRGSLLRWAEFALAPVGQAPAAHHRRLIADLEWLERGRGRKLMVLMPPGAAKSTYASVLFPAWYLARHARAQVIAAAHTRGLARHFGRQVRELVEEHGARLGYGLRADNRAAQRFSTSRGGEYYAAGVRSPIVGRRADLAIVDDPIRSVADAESARVREALWDWFRADLMTRLKPSARLLLVMTRWHRDDLAGRLLAHQAAGVEKWRVLKLPALAEADDPMGRAPGAALWPEWEDAAALAAKREAVGEQRWAALFQQEPVLGGGALFVPARLGVVERAPVVVRAVRGWDLASTGATGRDADWTVGVKLGRTEGGGFVVLDVVRLRGDPAEVEAAIKAMAAADGPGVAIGLPQDPGQAGKSQILYLSRQLAGFSVVASPESGSKRVRAAPVASQVNAGNVALLSGGWNGTFINSGRKVYH